MTKYLIAIALLVLLGYGFVEALPLISGPALTVASPKQDAVAVDGVVTVSGIVARTSVLTVNGATVLPEENGNFSTTLAFARGTSILTVTAADRFGRTVRRTRTIFVPN